MIKRYLVIKRSSDRSYLVIKECLVLKIIGVIKVKIVKEVKKE